VLWQAQLPENAVGLAWLGQAGFMLRHAQRGWLIDPYLSDHLAHKYAGTEFSHERMALPPVEAEAIRDLDLVLCTHRHGDHMDPGSLPILAANNPQCRFLVPRAEAEAAMRLGLDEARLLLANAGDTFRLDHSAAIHVSPAAHETIQINERGEHHCLGFIMRLGELTLYHSGDCVVFDGLAEALRPHRIDLALLPVNGRRPALTQRGIIGNMNFGEAVGLCLAAGISAMIPHHFGMFAFNTVDPLALQAQAARIDRRLHCLLPSLDGYLLIAKNG
jgi:L-ascorbate metabolism protein UlaG (beta-lactamase superfamily)